MIPSRKYVNGIQYGLCIPVCVFLWSDVLKYWNRYDDLIILAATIKLTPGNAINIRIRHKIVEDKTYSCLLPAHWYIYHLFYGIKLSNTTVNDLYLAADIYHGLMLVEICHMHPFTYRTAFSWILGENIIVNFPQLIGTSRSNLVSLVEINNELSPYHKILVQWIQKSGIKFILHYGILAWALV